MPRTAVLPAFVLPPDLAESLARARERWAKLAEAGTPYWCIHDEPDMDRGYSKPDNDDPIHPRHGFMCGDCHGYICEG